MAEKTIYEVVLHEVWKSNIRRGKFTTDGTYNIISNRGAEFAVKKAKSFALKQRLKGREGQDDKPYDDSCIEVGLSGVKPVLKVDC